MYYWKKEGCQFSEVRLPFSVRRILSVNWLFQRTAIINSFQLMCLHHKGTRFHVTSTKWMPSPFTTCQHCQALLHFGSSIEKCVMTSYESSGLYFHSDCVFWGSFGILWNLSLKFILFISPKVTQLFHHILFFSKDSNGCHFLYSQLLLFI